MTFHFSNPLQNGQFYSGDPLTHPNFSAPLTGKNVGRKACTDTVTTLELQPVCHPKQNVLTEIQIVKIETLRPTYILDVG